MCHYWISAHFTRAKETGTTQPALPEQSLIRLNLIIAPIFTPSHKSTAAGDGCGSRLLCTMGNNIHGPLSWLGSDLWTSWWFFIVISWAFQTNRVTFSLCFFLSSTSCFPFLVVGSCSVLSVRGLHRDALGCLCFNSLPFMSGCWNSVRAGHAQMSLF